ncbi:79e58243-2388-4a5d-9ba5-16934cc790b3-CDS [Sclerotinia trifoliorum]|uniref:79e58243-2388-4a5d-9ba5-16934cc790b3-CDS n=1 Tax=Sclerotinia trifoliorum TaxID=28548 RepID=A0A8H2ZN30_9HELO|nr:79e58243-2388-4a5d-9ba5-16934cc790b3-CDS [Sclerotinia trifoliorum]
MVEDNTGNLIYLSPCRLLSLKSLWTSLKAWMLMLSLSVAASIGSIMSLVMLLKRILPLKVSSHLPPSSRREQVLQLRAQDYQDLEPSSHHCGHQTCLFLVKLHVLIFQQQEFTPKATLISFRTLLEQEMSDSTALSTMTEIPDRPKSSHNIFRVPQYLHFVSRVYHSNHQPR